MFDNKIFSKAAIASAVAAFFFLFERVLFALMSFYVELCYKRNVIVELLKTV